MKKLMFGAAVAAMGLTTFGANPATQVYDVQLSIKSTGPAFAKNVTNKTNPLAVKDDGKWDISYRKQASYTWKGLIWGCDCEAIDGVWEEAEGYIPETGECGVSTETVKGCILWETKNGNVTYIGSGADLSDANTAVGAGFGWKLLQCINKDGKQVEGVWEMSQATELCGASVDFFWFVGAGFGSNKLVTYKDADGLQYVECESRIDKMSGNFAGYMWAPSKTGVTETGCTFCGGGKVVTCDFVYPWAWCEDFNDICDCNVDLFDPDHTAAYGTWTLKYNDSASKKLQKVTSILEAYNFKKLPYVADTIDAIEDIILGLTPPTPPEPPVKKAYAEAKAALADAQEKYDVAKADNDYYNYNGEMWWLPNTNRNAEVKAAGDAVMADYEVVKVAFSNAVEELKALETLVNDGDFTNGCGYVKTDLVDAIDNAFTKIGVANAANIAAQTAFEKIATATNEAQRIQFEKDYSDAKIVADNASKDAADAEAKVNKIIGALKSTTVQAKLNAALAKCKETGLAKDQFGDPNAKAQEARDNAGKDFDEKATAAGEAFAAADKKLGEAETNLKLAKMACDIAGEVCE